ncbi:MAG: hypothetical protein WA960_05885 [Tunicatimonas sp.]
MTSQNRMTKKSITKLFVVVLLASLSACGNGSQEAEECYGKSSVIMLKASVFGMQKAYIRGKIALSRDSAFVNDLLSTSSLLESAADELVVASGGIEENTSRLLNECGRGEKSADIVREKQLALKEQLDRLRRRYDSQRYQASIVKISKAANEFFYDDGKASSNSHRELAETPISILISDITAMQSFINSILLVDYL